MAGLRSITLKPGIGTCCNTAAMYKRPRRTGIPWIGCLDRGAALGAAFDASVHAVWGRYPGGGRLVTVSTLRLRVLMDLKIKLRNNHISRDIDGCRSLGDSRGNWICYLYHEATSVRLSVDAATLATLAEGSFSRLHWAAWPSFNRFFCFIRRFWNQIFTWVSLRHSAAAISMRRALVKYLLKWNSFSSSVSCLFVKLVRPRLGGKTPATPATHGNGPGVPPPQPLPLPMDDGECEGDKLDDRKWEPFKLEWPEVVEAVPL